MISSALWVYLSTTPLFWLTLTLLAWIAADRIAGLFGRHPLANPLVFAVAMLAAALGLTGTPYHTYFDGAQFVHFLLGPATVALGVPLWRHRSIVLREIVPMAVALLVGSAAAIASAVVFARVLGGSGAVVVSMAPKSVTAPVAMAISEGLGGLPALTAAVVILTGILGAIIGLPVMSLLGIRDRTARGFAVGLAAHGVGTARAFSVDPLIGVFSGIAMGLNAMLTAFLVPLLLPMLR